MSLADDAVIGVEPHPLLHAAAFLTELPAPLGMLGDAPPEPSRAAQFVNLLRTGAEAPLPPDDSVRSAIRDMLRQGGYKPTGRGKPASEYLRNAAEAGTLQSINVVVDVANAVSLHSGLPISVVDTALARPPWRIAIAPGGSRYVFNAARQEIDVGGLICLFDAAGPCANAVKDAQRTKTTASTMRTLSVIWGTASHAARVDAAVDWYRALLAEAGAATLPVVLQVPGPGG